MSSYIYLDEANSPLTTLLRGGLLAGTITEVSGMAGSGKSNLALTALASAVTPAPRGSGGSAVLIDPEPVHIEAFERALQHRGAAHRASALYRRSVRQPAEFLHTLCVWLPTVAADARERGEPVKLVVIDSVAGVYRLFETNYGTRARHFAAAAAALAAVAQEYECAVLVVNQVSALIVDEPADLSGVADSLGQTIDARIAVGYRSGNDMVHPALGLAWQNCLHSSIALARRGSQRTLSLRRCPWAPPGNVGFIIDNDGWHSLQPESGENYE